MILSGRNISKRIHRKLVTMAASGERGFWKSRARKRSLSLYTLVLFEFIFTMIMFYFFN